MDQGLFLVILLFAFAMFQFCSSCSTKSHKENQAITMLEENDHETLKGL